MKKTYISVDGKAKPVRRMYVSVDGKAKLVRRVYGSVNGQAKIIYDTCVVSYVYDNNYIDHTTVSATERVATGSKATKRDGKHWYKSNGTEWDFNTQLTGDVTLYEAVYQDADDVTFDGSHYVPTDVVVPKSQGDFRGSCTISSVTAQQRLMSIWGTPAIEIYVDSSKKWNVGVGENTGSVRWGLRGNEAFAAVAGTGMAFRLNPYAVNTSGTTGYSQMWADNASPNDGQWHALGITLTSTPSAVLCIGGSQRATDTNFRGVIRYINFAGGNMTPKKRIKGGTTVQGFYNSSTKKFYPLVAH